MNSTNYEMTNNNHVEVSEEKIKELRELVSKVLAEPKSMLAIVELKEFISELPYGSLPDKVLVDVADAVSKANRML
ncbi:MAG: hypothetical protein IJZ96_08355 [Lachnospiraceae bacterium]|nr:hypothetical protein [Lachnospiraceae bacterium]